MDLDVSKSIALEDIPGDFKNQKYNLITAIVNYRKAVDKISDKLKEPEKHEIITNAKFRNIEVLDAIKKLTDAKKNVGDNELSPIETMYLDIFAGIKEVHEKKLKGEYSHAEHC